MNHLVLFALLLLGIQAASGSARHLMSEFRGGKVTTLEHVVGMAPLLPGATTDVATTHSRALKAEPACPIPGCDPQRCELIDNGGFPGYKCTLCQNLLLLKDNACYCPPGRYGTYLTCADCPKGSYCEGGKYTATAPGTNTPAAVACPSVGSIQMTTIGTRAVSIAKCVNPPGTFYALINDNPNSPTAVACPSHTYGPGLKKQRACVPCPPGYTTEKVVGEAITPQTGQSLKSACVVPEGYFSKAPGVIAKCPPGEYKSGLGAPASCNKCAAGATTESDGSKTEGDCKVLLPSYKATGFSAGGGITGTAKCAMGHYCPGGNTSNRRRLLTDPKEISCPAGTYTEHEGATSEAECLVPPGHYLQPGPHTPDDDTMVPCPAGTYRAEWRAKSAARQSDCEACGDGISAQDTEQVTLPSTLNDIHSTPTTKLVRASAASCYIKPGQGMLRTPAGNFKAVWCDNNNYGAANIKFGLEAAPCTACPNNMVAIKPLFLPSDFYHDDDQGNGAPTGPGGFTSPTACVTKEGFGYDGRASYKCPPGWFNAGNNRDACTQCPVGQTTSDIASQQKTLADCGIAPSFGFHDGAIVPCPVGTYNDVFRGAGINNKECTPCPEHTSTFQSGGSSKADCNVCQAGYGHDPAGPVVHHNNPALPDTVPGNCVKQCGSTTTGATFGGAGRPIGTDCEVCPPIATGFYFAWNEANHPYKPLVVARAGAESPGDCLAEFGQVNDVGAWYVGGAAPLTEVTGANTLEACAAHCKNPGANSPECEYITFDYKTSKCYKKVNSDADQEFAGIGGEVVAYKAILAADTGAQSAKVKGKSALASGSYTFYWESSIPIGTPSDAAAKNPKTNADWKFQECLDACDAEGDCLGAGMTHVTKEDSPDLQETSVIGSCRIIKGVASAGVGKRSVVKVNVARLSLQAAAAVAPEPDKGCTTECASCVADGDWHKCDCTGKNWDPVARACVDYIPVLLDDRRFMIFATPKNYKDAYYTCHDSQYGAELATLRNQDETDKLIAKAPAVMSMWMGLVTKYLSPANPDATQPQSDKAQWVWLSTQHPPEWDHWATLPYPAEPEPNLWANNEGRCAAVYGTVDDPANLERPNGSWNDAQCSSTYNFVCEK